MVNKKKSFTEILGFYASVLPNKNAYIFLKEGERMESHITFKELMTEVVILAGMFQELGFSNQRILLCLPNSIEYIVSFLACLFTKNVAVPLYPLRSSPHTYKLLSILEDAQAVAILTTDNFLLKMDPIIKTIKGETISCYAIESLLSESRKYNYSYSELKISPEDIAFLQYTSGSTSNPKGVIVTHNNLMSNAHLTRIGFRQTEESVIATWLPFYHDMGLIGHVLQSLYQGNTNILMTPFDFIQKPFRWLKAISDYKVNISGAPNFAFDLCIKKINDEQKSCLDLTDWSVAYNGAEPVKIETINGFYNSFMDCGFSKKAMFPGYGLAENTLIATLSYEDETNYILTVSSGMLKKNKVVVSDPEEKDAFTFVSCGRPISNCLVISIVHPNTMVVCKEGEIGEIWVKGPTVTRGYWMKAEESNKTFLAYDKNGDGPYLRTGDLGFLHKDNLFVTGRIKDVIIMCGENYYPQDIELTVEKSHSAIIPTCVAAFTITVNASEEKLILVAEIDRKYRVLPWKDQETVYKELLGIVNKVRESVAEMHNLMVYDVVLIKQASIPKTTSGKIQRQACKTAYLNKTLKKLTAFR